jgi:predicted amidohydrolase YtcJ
MEAPVISTPTLARRTLLIAVLSPAFWGGGVEARASESPSADLVLTGARVYTVDASRSWAEALAVREGRLVYVGTDAGARAFAGAATRVVDVGGRLVLPAFRDSHVHPVSAGIEMGLCDLNGLRTSDEIAARVRGYAAEHEDRPWVLGGGWDLPLFPEANPTRALLDSLVPDRPALLSAADGHSAWVNSAALSAAGLTRETPDPPHGRIERDPDTGEPSGTLRESAIALVSRHAPSPAPGEHAAGLRRALKELNRLGIVAFQEASADEPTLGAYLQADREGWLSARARVSLLAVPEEGEDQVGRLLEMRRRGSRRVRPEAVKLFLDGVIEAQTAALLEPYLDPRTAAPGPSASRGLPLWTPGALSALVTHLDREGFQVHMHAIGDGAVRMGLDAVEAAREANGARDARHHMVHIQLFDPADIPRFHRLGVIADFQALWAYADSYITDLTEPVLGPERSRWLYPIASLVASGAVVVGGSDWSVSSANPLDAIEVGVTRRDLGAEAGPAWIPEERVDLPRMIATYTIGGAYASFEEDETGSLEAGKWADLVVLDRDIFELPPHEIHTARVVWTLLEGETVWRDEGWRP